jgi:hypothetical protein
MRREVLVDCTVVESKVKAVCQVCDVDGTM